MLILLFPSLIRRGGSDPEYSGRRRGGGQGKSMSRERSSVYGLPLPSIALNVLGFLDIFVNNQIRKG